MGATAVVYLILLEVALVLIWKCLLIFEQVLKSSQFDRFCFKAMFLFRTYDTVSQPQSYPVFDGGG